MGKKILLLTGRCAASEAKKVADSVPNVVVHVCDVDVAAFLSPETILQELSSLDLSDVSLVIVSGAVRGSLSEVSRRLGIRCVKGTKSIFDMPLVLRMLKDSKISLSPEVSADVLIESEIKERDERIIKEAKKLRSGATLKIGRRNPIYLGTGLMHILAEIPDAPKLSDEEIRMKASYFVESGASIIDLGMVYGVDYSSEVNRLVEAVRSIVKVPISIDSLNKKEILDAVDAGVDFVLSLDYSNIDIVSSIDVPVVIIPQKRGRVPSSVRERIRLLNDLMKKMDSFGFNQYVVDPVIDPPLCGLMNSLSAFAEFRRLHPRIPMLAGVGNVTEMIDSDSIGVNALLATLCAELDVDILFTTEASPKTRGSVSELSRAAELMYLAKRRNQPPKDMSRNLLVLKDKIRFETPKKDKVEEVVVSEYPHEDLLENIFFRIDVSDRIEVLYYQGNKPKLRFVGSSAEALYKEIISRKLIKNMVHAAYLGRELAKAETALKIGKNYVQDEGLF